MDKKKLEDIVNSNFSRHLAVAFIFILLIIGIINFVFLKERIKPEVGKAIGSLTVDGVNITAQIKTIKGDVGDEYRPGEVVYITDPP